MTEPLVVDNVPVDRLQRLMDKGVLVTPEALDFMIEKLGTESPAAKVKEKIAELTVPYLDPVVVFDTEQDALVLLWVQKKDDHASGEDEVFCS